MITSPCPAAESLLRSEVELVEEARRPLLTPTRDIAERLKNLSADDRRALAAFDPWKSAFEQALEIQQKISGTELHGLHLTAGEIPDASWHAQTISVADHENCYLICASSALRDAIYTLAKSAVYLSRGQGLFLSAGGSHFVSAQADSPADLVNRVLRAHTARIRTDDGWVRAASFKLDPEETRYAVVLAVTAEVFVMLHELEHIRRGHLRMSPDSDQERRDREHQCDVAALSALLTGAPAVPATQVVLGVELALAAQTVLEGAQWWLRPDGHPLGMDRHRSVVEWFRANANPEQMASVRGLWLSPSQLVSDVLEVEYQPPYPESLGQLMTTRPDLFDIAVLSDDQRVAVRDWFDRSERIERVMRFSPFTHYVTLAETLFEPNRLARAVSWIAEREPGLVSKSRFAEMNAMAEQAGTRYGRTEADDRMLNSFAEFRKVTAYMCVGQVAFYEHVLARFDTFVKELLSGGERAVRYDSIASHVTQEFGEDAVLPVLSVVFQLKGGQGGRPARRVAFPISDGTAAGLCSILGITHRTGSPTAGSVSFYQEIGLDMIRRSRR